MLQVQMAVEQCYQDQFIYILFLETKMESPLQKKQKYLTSFKKKRCNKNEYKEWFSNLKMWSYIKCKRCSRTFTVKYNGIKPVQSHYDSKEHKNSLRT